MKIRILFKAEYVNCTLLEPPVRTPGLKLKTQCRGCAGFDARAGNTPEAFIFPDVVLAGF